MIIKKQILDRYSRTPDNRLMIDISAGKIEYLYNNFDKHTPYVRKELDQHLVEYIIDSVREIGKEDFVIQFRFTETPDAGMMSRIKTSIQNYFLYLEERELREFASMRQSSMILFIIGVVVLSLSVWINQRLAEHDTVIVHVFAGGLNVAAWVSLWHAIAIYLLNWAPHRRQIKMFERISQAPIIFSDAEPDAPL